MIRKISRRGHATGWLLEVALVLPVLTAGCGGGGSASVPPPVDDSGYNRGNNGGYSSGYSRGSGTGYDSGFNRQLGAPMAPSTGMSKTVMLAGAAALYYLYKKHQSSAAQGAEGQYYLSKNGRVYYRDAEHRAHWVSPPAEGLRVPEHETQGLEGFQGYNNSTVGRDLSNLPEGR